MQLWHKFDRCHTVEDETEEEWVSEAIVRKV
jgi:hypothetical protein